MGSFNSKIRLEIISALNDAGIKATADQLDQLQNKVNDTGLSAQGLGKDFKAAFNPMEAITSVATGNINGIAKAAVQLGYAIKGVTVSVGTMTGIFGGVMIAVSVIRKLIDVFKDEKSAIDLATEAAEKNAKAIQDTQKATRESIKTAFGKVDEASKRRNAELEAIENEIAAEKRLQMETAKRNGDLETAVKLQNEIAQSTKDEAIKRKQNAIGDIDKKIAAVEKTIAGASTYDPKVAEKERRRLNAAIMQKRKELADNTMVVQGVTGATVIDKRPRAEIEKEIKDLEEAKANIVKRNAQKNIGKGEIDKLKADRMNLERDLNAYRKIQIADAIKTETDEVKKQNEERIKAEQELHRQRMANLKAEADAAKGALNEAKSRFEREFSLYKSADKGASAIEAEKADEAARKQLQKDASRYGGKWRIDELSRLYAANDEEGVKSALSSWRKSKSFTPEVEAMVRAAAAGENVKSMEDRVAEIAENTKGLAAKVEELLTMKGE